MRVHPCCLLFLTCLASTATAQRGAPPSFEGPRGPLILDLSDGEPVSAFIEAGRVLELTDVQKRRLMDIRRNLRVQNKPFMSTLDSLRALAARLPSGRSRRSCRRETARVPVAVRK